MKFMTWLAQRWANIVRPTDNHTPTVRFNANVGPTLSCYLGYGRKNAIFVGKGYVFYKFYKRLQNKIVCVLIYYIGKGYFLTGQSEKWYQFQNVEHTV